MNLVLNNKSAALHSDAPGGYPCSKQHLFHPIIRMDGTIYATHRKVFDNEDAKPLVHL